jgi:serine/threonine-protein kinase
VIQACDAISEAHCLGIVHRDLKPANLFLSKRPNGSPIIKVLDFGISKTQDASVDNLTKTTAAMGSALYMSPEQMQQTRGVDHRTDIYALGISLYELLAGRQPFYAETMPQLCAEIFTGTPTPLRDLRPDIPETLGAVLEKAYARDRELRYSSIAEFVVALAPWAPRRSQPVIDSSWRRTPGCRRRAALSSWRPSKTRAPG